MYSQYQAMNGESQQTTPFRPAEHDANPFAQQIHRKPVFDKAKEFDYTRIDITESHINRSGQSTHSGISNDGHRPHILQAWWLELFSIIIACCTIGAMVGLIYQYRIERPAPNWPTCINLNAIISIMSLIIRASISLVASEALSQQK